MTRIDKCLAAYNHVLKILEINNDNYFKRTQILMIVAQSALFVAFAKVLAVKDSRIFDGFALLNQRGALLLITGFGAVFAGLWYLFIRRQCNVLNLCKGYLRGIENYLMRLGVPSAYWTYESKLSHPRPRRIQPVIRFKIESDFFTTQECDRLPFPLEDPSDHPDLQNDEKFPRRKFQFRCAIRSWWSCRREDQHFQRFWIGLTRIEKAIALLLCIAWLFLFALLLIPVFLPDC